MSGRQRSAAFRTVSRALRFAAASILAACLLTLAPAQQSEGVPTVEPSDLATGGSEVPFPPPIVPAGAPVPPRVSAPAEPLFDSAALVVEARKRASALQAKLGTNRIGLLDAVRVTLLHDPQVQLAREDAALARGAVQLARGIFDARLATSIGAGRNSRELTRAEIAQQSAAREQARATVRQIEAAQAGPGAATPQQALASQFQALQSEVLLSMATPEQLARFQALNTQQSALAVQESAAAADTAAAQRRAAEAQADAARVDRVRSGETISASASVQKLFRNGIGVGPFVEFDQFSDALARRAGQPAISRSQIGLGISVPLGKGLGARQTAAPEIAALIDYDASLLVLRHVTSASVLRTVLAYWDCVGAQERLALFVRSELTNGVLVRLSSALIAADELAPSELTLIQARETAAGTVRLAAELDLLQARQRLAIAMGLSAGEMIDAPLPSDRFPRAIAREALQKQSAEALIEEALERRQDRQASLKLDRSRKVLVDAAVLNLRPRVDLQIRAGYTGLSEGSGLERSLESFTSGLTGPAVSGSLTVDWPFASTAERGNLAQAEALGRQSLIRTADLTRNIASNVVFSREAVLNSLERRALAQQAAEAFQTALSTERERFRLGSSTLLDSIQTEERLTDALVQVVAAEALYAQSVATVRFETGTLLPSDPSASMELRRERLVTQPGFSEPPPPPPVNDLRKARLCIFRNAPNLRGPGR